jgi:hypothetical protein
MAFSCRGPKIVLFQVLAVTKLVNYALIARCVVHGSGVWSHRTGFVRRLADRPEGREEQVVRLRRSRRAGPPPLRMTERQLSVAGGQLSVTALVPTLSQRKRKDGAPLCILGLEIASRTFCR